MNIIDLLKKHEGLRLHPYKDSVGKLTIGYGRNLDDVGISVDEADLMLKHDIHKAEIALDLYLPWWRTLDGVRRSVLTDMCFNLGITGLMQFRRMLQAIESEDWAEAKKEGMDSKWARQVGLRAVDLMNALESGAWSD